MTKCSKVQARKVALHIYAKPDDTPDDEETRSTSRHDF